MGSKGHASLFSAGVSEGYPWLSSDMETQVQPPFPPCAGTAPANLVILTGQPLPPEALKEPLETKTEGSKTFQ